MYLKNTTLAAMAVMLLDFSATAAATNSRFTTKTTSIASTTSSTSSAVATINSTSLVPETSIIDAGTSLVTAVTARVGKSATANIGATGVSTAKLEQELAASNSANCTTYEFITVRGGGDNQTDPWWMQPFRDGVVSQVSGGSLYEVMYPAAAGDTVSVVQSVLLGSISMSAYANLRGAVCPETKFIIAGYSEGAGVTTMALNSMQAIFPRILGVVLWGSPFWTPNRIENRGDGTEGAGEFSWLPYRVPAALEPKTNDFCLYSDDVCTGDIPLGYTTHGDYRDTHWETDSIDWMVAKLHEAGIY